MERTPKERPNITTTGSTGVGILSMSESVEESPWLILLWPAEGYRTERKPSPGQVCLHAGILEDLLAVGIEAQVPKAARCHEALRVLQLAVASQQCVDELDAGVAS